MNTEIVLRLSVSTPAAQDVQGDRQCLGEKKKKNAPVAQSVHHGNVQKDHFSFFVRVCCKAEKAGNKKKTPVSTLQLRMKSAAGSLSQHR